MENLVTYEDLMTIVQHWVTKDIVFTGMRQGFVLCMIVFLICTIISYLYEKTLEIKYKRENTYSGRLLPEECNLLDNQFKKCEENFTDENLKQLGTLAFTFIKFKKETDEEMKKFWNKFKFWKRKDK